MEDIESILPHNCTIPINPCRETTFLTSASSEYERDSLREVPDHHRVPWNVEYPTPPPVPSGNPGEPRSISQLINRREHSFTSDADTELEGLRTSDATDPGRNTSLSKSTRSDISLGNVFEKGLPHNKIVPYDSVFPYRLPLPNVKIDHVEDGIRRRKCYCYIVTIMLAVFVVGVAILAMVLAVNLAT